MPFHYWGDDFDWNSLYEAEKEIRRIVRFARVGLNSKEKYGTLRYDFRLFEGSIHSITHPGHYYIRYPKHMYGFVTTRFLSFLEPLICSIQVAFIKLAFTIVCRRYPHIVKEIVSDAPPELLPTELALIQMSMWSRSCNNEECRELFAIDLTECPYCGTERV